MKAALWKYDKELGYAFFCPDCKKFVCVSGKCECGTKIDLDLPQIAYSGRVKFSGGKNGAINREERWTKCNPT